MVQRTAVDRAVVARALSRIPDLPQWIDTRGMLLSGRGVVATGPESDLAAGFVVVVQDAALMSVVGRPDPVAIRRAAASLTGDVNAIAQLQDARSVAAALRGWSRHAAIIHVLPEIMPWEREHDPGVRIFTRETAPRFDHVPERLRRELLDALAGRPVSRFVAGDTPSVSRARRTRTVPMSSAWADGRPASFCYPVWETETWWDVSIDTLEPYRGRGLGGRAARALVRHLRQTAKAPVWGALETNRASRALAARLGFIEAAGIAIFSSRRGAKAGG